jgi:hypothetical protein
MRLLLGAFSLLIWKFMRRMHLFEFIDFVWYPQIFRQMQTDSLQFATGLGSGHKNLVPLFHKA